MKIEKDKVLKNYTTFKIGGKADFFIEAKNTNEIIKAVEFSKSKKIPYAIIGNGSNILINDKGFRGLVIKINSKKIKIENNYIIADSGVSLANIISYAKKNNLGGAEFLAGIPGTLGGAIYGNAGTGENSISQIISSIKALNQKGKIIDIKKDKLTFGYRNSIFKFKNNDYIILEAKLRLKWAKNTTIEKNIKTLLSKRGEQPWGYSAGSIFKNPSGLKAGELIEKAKLKGEKRGDAQISPKHANFIINLKNAKASNIKFLIDKIQKEVLNKFSVQLEREIRYLEERGWNG